MNEKKPTVRVWLNLHKKCWSIQRGRCPVEHVKTFRLVNVRFQVSEAGRQRVLQTRRRKVHAYAIGEEAPLDKAPASVGEEVSYNPYRMNSFYRKSNYSAVFTADEVWFTQECKALLVNNERINV